MWNWKEWTKAAIIRALKTFAQTAAASITVGAAAEEVQWLRILSVSGVAFVLSLLTSLGGLPEVRRTEPPDADKTDTNE
ncbi:MAG: hypothetical protein IJ153_06130 [Clostridia bacterium]|nr:hypothetical protein [Clostridia bacterium]